MKNILKLSAVALFATLTGCVNSDVYDTPNANDNCTDLTANQPVSILLGSPTNVTPTYPAYKQYTGEDIIEAYVTSSDEGGNFYKSLSLVSLDGTTGFSIPVDDYNLYTKFPPGRKVFVNLKDRYYQFDSNAVIVGSLFNNDTPSLPTDDKVGRISIVDYRNIITKSCTSVADSTLVNKVTIAQAKSNSYLNKLIEVDNVQFADGSAGKKYYDATVNSVGSATNHTITDADGNTVIVRVSQYATFANDIVPTKSGKIRGVMTKFGSTYQFMIRTLNDVKLTKPRVQALFEESFTTGFPNWTKFSVSGAQVWTLNATLGNPGQCADMNGFSGSAVTNEDWLISPSVNLTGVAAPKLTFQTAKNFTGPALQVLVSTNYSGSGTPTAATWVPLTATMATANSFVWTNSGNVSLTPYANNAHVYIAFKYLSTASPAAAAQWRVDNVKVQ